MIAIDDPDLPGLSDLDLDALRRIAGTEAVSLMRLRYRAGERAILHLETGTSEGSVWFFKGGKARRLARRNKATARYDAISEALFQPFPNDHRMPQIRAFLDDYQAIAPRLIGARPLGAPRLLRYRPGLSCTFRCRGEGGVTAYVKLIAEDNPANVAELNRQIVSHLGGGPLAIAPVIGTAPEVTALAYAAAAGRPLDAELAATSDSAAALQAIDALRRFWALPLTPARLLTADTLLARGAESVALTSAVLPAAAQAIAAVFARLQQRKPALAIRPIHADMKLEHLFLDGARTTLIDTESVSLGPPDYDLAQLYGRLWQAELEGQLPRRLVEPAARDVARAAGRSFAWCRDVVALRLAKFYAQRPTPEAAHKVTAILERLS